MKYETGDIVLVKGWPDPLLRRTYMILFPKENPAGSYKAVRLGNNNLYEGIIFEGSIVKVIGHDDGLVSHYSETDRRGENWVVMGEIETQKEREP